MEYQTNSVVLTYSRSRRPFGERKGKHFNKKELLAGKLYRIYCRSDTYFYSTLYKSLTFMLKKAVFQNKHKKLNGKKPKAEAKFRLLILNLSRH